MLWLIGVHAKVCPKVTLTFVVDLHPFVELAFVRHCVKVAALVVPERGLSRRTRSTVTNPVPPTLTHTVFPSIFWPRRSDRRKNKQTFFNPIKYL